MTRVTGSDYAVMCNFLNTHPHPHTDTLLLHTDTGGNGGGDVDGAETGTW